MTTAVAHPITVLKSIFLLSLSRLRNHTWTIVNNIRLRIPSEQKADYQLADSNNANESQ